MSAENQKERSSPPLHTLRGSAPIRICDLGGWTDTWFAGVGEVLNIAVAPRVEVRIAVYPRDAVSDRVTIRAENFDEVYVMEEWNRDRARHPLIEAAIYHVGIPEEVAVRIALASDVPAGASTGTSGALLVALVGALDGLLKGTMTRHEIAMAAHHVEMDLVGWQSGIQDQLCSAYGGINSITMERFPEARVSPLRLPARLRTKLEENLLLVFLGRAHSSSDTHLQVIEELESEGAGSVKLEALRRTARSGRDALLAGDLQRFGSAMSENTEAQRRLHAGLVCEDAEKLIRLAREHGALGWKVNGAGGDGGSVTILRAGDEGRKRELSEAIVAANPRFQLIPVTLDTIGFHLEETNPPS